MNTTHAGSRARQSWMSPAALCRWAGAGAVILSGALYLLQGVEQISLQARTWAYLAVMAGLAGGGVASRLALRDAKGARVFFALALALVPLQFSQIGGMIHELVAGGTAGPRVPAALFDYSGVTPASTIAFLALTLCVTPVITYAGCSILARAHARRLTIALIVLCVALLTPVRASAPGFALLAAYVIVAFVLEGRWFQEAAVFRTLEGRTLRAIFMLPLAIVAGRTALHVDTLAGSCAFVALLGLIMMRGANRWTASTSLRRLIQGTGVIGVASSWIGYALVAFDRLHGGYLLAVAMLPLAALLLDVSRLDESAAPVHRLFASLIVLVVALGLVGDIGSAMAGLAALASGVLLGAWGVLRREREPVMFGSAAAVAGVCGLLARAVRAADVSAWIALALAGAALVFGSSVIERYGRRAINMSQTAMAEWRAWR